MSAQMQVRVADYIAKCLADFGVRHVFMLTGGGAMHLNDALAFEPRLRYICNHHEQACAIAAEGYARVANRIGVVNVTTGPGGLNAITGVFGAWTDSIPILVLSGQVRRDTIMSSCNIAGLRQLGDQEVDIVDMVRKITKYAALVSDPNSIRYELEKALHLATTGRPGPCWLDIPIDVQGSRVDPDLLTGFEAIKELPVHSAGNMGETCREVLSRLRGATRPVIMIGSGVRLAGAQNLFDALIPKLGIPVAPSWTAIDAIDWDHPLYCGRPGTVGNRSGNFSVQNADVLLVIGSRLPIRQVSYNWNSFAKDAYKIIVDIDEAELRKPMVRPDLPIHADAHAFLKEMNHQVDECGYVPNRHAAWLAWCRYRLARYPVVLPRHRVNRGKYINPYYFMEAIFDRLDSDDVVVCGDATASVVAFQAARIKKGQRVFTNAGCAQMGYDLPAAIGAAFAREPKRVICLAGDGSLQLNIQELQTVVHHQLPIKLFVMNNEGYLSMRLSQGNFFKRFVGEGPRTGVSMPDTVKIAQAYGLPGLRMDGDNFLQILDQVLAAPGPSVCDVILDPEQPYEPKLSSRPLPDGRIVSAALDDMAPFLDEDELKSNRITLAIAKQRDGL